MKILRENLANLKAIVVALLAIAKKRQFSQYLRIELEHNIEDKIEFINYDILEPIKSQLQSKFSTIKSSHDNEALMRLSDLCKQCTPVINEFQKYKTSLTEKLAVPSLDQLINEIAAVLTKSMTDISSAIKTMVNENFPETIDFI